MTPELTNKLKWILVNFKNQTVDLDTSVKKIGKTLTDERWRKNNYSRIGDKVVITNGIDPVAHYNIYFGGQKIK